MKLKTLLTFLCAGILFPSFAQKQLTDTIRVDEVVVTASKVAQSAGNVTQKIDIVDSRDIRLMVQGNSNLTEALQYRPGSSVSALSRNDANWGTYSGIAAKYSTIMLQGLPLDAFVDPMSLDLLAIERIEVQRGPASVIYPNYLSQDFAGNQSPLAGTINLIMKEKIDRPTTKVSTAYGSYNTFNGQFYHQGRSGNLSYFAGAMYESSDYTNYGTENSWLNMKDNPEYKKTKVYGGMTLLPGGNGKQKFTLFANKTLHNGDAGRVYRGFDHNYGTLNAGYAVDLNNYAKLQANMGLRQYDRSSQESNFGVLDTLKSNNGVVQTILPADISLSVKHGENNLLVAGTDFQRADYSTWSDPLTGVKAFGNKSSSRQIGFYAQEEYHIQQLIVRGGLRYNLIRNTIDLVDGNAPGQPTKDWSSLPWSAGLKYNFGKTASVYANAGNSFLTPGLKSTGGTIKLTDKDVVGKNGQLPNPDLKPESGLGVDAGVDINLPNQIKVSVRGFYIAIQDAIIENVVSQNPSQTQSVNAGETTSAGAEFEVKQRISSSLNWFANYTYTNSSVNNAGSVPFAPEHVANMGITMATNFGLTLSPMLNYNNGFYDSSDINSRGFFKPGALLNININQEISASEEHKIDIFGNFYNVTNNKYEMPWQFKNTGLSMMIGVRATF